jgi:hypothetical protein
MREIMVWDADQTVLFGEKEVSLQISKRLSPEVPADVVKSQLGVGVDTRSCSYTTLFGMSGRHLMERKQKEACNDQRHTLHLVIASHIVGIEGMDCNTATTM